MRRTVVTVLVILLVLALPGVLLGGLILTGVARVGDPMMDPVAATPSPSAADVVPAAEAATLEPAIAYAISQRTAFGLRADEAWVRSVAADPRARINMLDFLMLPEEEAEFQARTDRYDTVAQAVDVYGQDHRDQFGGVWIDQQRHTVVAAWTANPDIHRLAILAGLGGQGPLEVRLVRYSEADLRALQEHMTNDRDWLSTIGAMMTSSSVDIMDNRASLDISSANPDAPTLILAHYGVGADKLKVFSDGTGILLQPRGTIEGTVVTADGKVPPADPFLDLRWAPDRPGGGDCGNMTGQSPNEDGTFTLPCAPGGWTISVEIMQRDAWVTVGSGHVVVPPGGTVKVTITLSGEPAPSP